MRNNTLGAMLARQLNVSLEDNAAVEINFAIDTDEDGAPVAPDAVEESAIEVNDATAEANEADGEAESAESDMDQLQEAQDSLESLGSVLTKHVEGGTMSRMGVGFYKLALESIVGKDTLEEIGIPSLESHSYSKHHASLIAMESHSVIQQHFESISMEAQFDWFKKVAHKIDVFFRAEKALLKRANALNVLASGSANEHSSNDELQVNSRKSPQLYKLLTVQWDTQEEFLEQVKIFTGLYMSMTTVKGGFDDEFVDNLFPGSDKWPQGKDGKPTKTMFGVRLVRGDTILGHKATDVTSPTKVPNLTPAMCKSVLDEVITMLSHGHIMYDNLWAMLRIMEKSETRSRSTSTTVGQQRGALPADRITTKSTTVHEENTYAEGHEEMFDTMINISHLKNKVVTEILNYVNFSLTDRDFV